MDKIKSLAKEVESREGKNSANFKASAKIFRRLANVSMYDDIVKKIKVGGTHIDKKVDKEGNEEENEVPNTLPDELAAKIVGFGAPEQGKLFL